MNETSFITLSIQKEILSSQLDNVVEKLETEGWIVDVISEDGLEPQTFIKDLGECVCGEINFRNCPIHGNG